MHSDTDAVMGIVRGLVAAALFVAFMMLWVRVYSRRNRDAFAAAARAPLEEDIRAGS
ncbi:MAG TPA: hypothetical protein VJQ47_13080 [Steroidobacteraceae bacterium]|nr:hypothetical protein [Steroidobacteraceae bacterium]